MVGGWCLLMILGCRLLCELLGLVLVCSAFDGCFTELQYCGVEITLWFQGYLFVCLIAGFFWLCGLLWWD